MLEDAHLYKAIDRLKYIQYWKNEISQLNEAIKQVDDLSNLRRITADLDKYARIRARFDDLIDLLSDMNALTPEMHTTHDFDTLISAVEAAQA